MSDARRSDIAAVAEPIHRLSVVQYRRMAEAGVIGPDDDIELLEGVLVDKMTKNPPHRIATHRTRMALERLILDGYYVDTQEPIETDDSEPEPDVAVIRGKTEDYVASHPPAAAVRLIVEIADTTVARDRVLKARVYARAGIPVYWLVDLISETLEVFEHPVRELAAYQTTRQAGRGDRVVLALDGRELGEIDADALLPPRAVKA